MFSFLKRLRRPKSGQEDESMPNAIVLLLRESRWLDVTEIAAAGERAWGERFNRANDHTYGVYQDGAVTVVKAGSAVVNLLHGSGPYFGTTPEEVEQIAGRFPRKEQRAAWSAHRAWMSLDDLVSYGKQEAKAKAESYAALARLTQHLVDANCCGLYLPKEHVFLPANGAVEAALQQMHQEIFFR